MNRAADTIYLKIADAGSLIMDGTHLDPLLKRLKLTGAFTANIYVRQWQWEVF